MNHIAVQLELTQQWRSTVLLFKKRNEESVLIKGACWFSKHHQSINMQQNKRDYSDACHVPFLFQENGLQKKFLIPTRPFRIFVCLFLFLFLSLACLSLAICYNHDFFKDHPATWRFWIFVLGINPAKPVESRLASELLGGVACDCSSCLLVWGYTTN